MIMNTGLLGISTLVFRESELDDALEKISRTKMKTIDLSIILPSFCPHYNPLATDRTDDLILKELIESYDLKVSTLNVVPGYFNRDLAEDVKKYMRRAIDIAALLKAHSVTIPSGAKVGVQEWEASVLRVRENLVELNKYAQDRNICISIETPHVRTLTESIEETAKFHKILGESSIKCTLDTSHVQRLVHSKVVDVIQNIGVSKINHVHLRDGVGEDLYFTPGKGDFDFRTFFAYMKSQSFDGDYVLELEYEDMNEFQKFEEIEFAREYCTELLNEGKPSLYRQIQTTRMYKFIGRVRRNYKAEIKRHKRLFSVLKNVKTKIKPYMPEIVYDGRWSRKIRWNKRRIIRHRENSVRLLHKPCDVLKIGIVGCGWAGMQMHAPGFQRLEGVKIVGCYDIVPKRTQACAVKFRAKACHDLDELILGLRPDVISVCSREWAHHEAVMKALNNGVDVFCEKLLATRYGEALEMVDTAKRLDRVLGVNYNYHYMPGIRKIKEIIVQQALGKLAFLNINVHAFSYAHALDLLSFLGGEIASVSAYYKNDNNIRKFGGTDWSVYDDDILYVPSIAASVSVEFANGTIGILNSSYYYNLYAFVLSIEAIFEEGAVSLSGINMFDTVGKLTYFPPNRIKKVDMKYKRGVYAKGYEYTFYESIQDFMNCYIVKKPVPTDGTQALFNIKIEKMIAQSNANHKKICVNEFKG